MRPGSTDRSFSDLARAGSFWNPRLPTAMVAMLERLRRQNPLATDADYIWVATSGSSGTAKLVGLKKSAVLVAASAVNAALEATQADTWLLSLPTFHVGGLGILARAELSGARVVPLDAAWSPEAFAKALADSRATLTSLVPTQVSDLVAANVSSTPSLRAVLAGGAAMSPELLSRARELGWPLVVTYGMTETAALCALGPGPEHLRVLPHMEVKVMEDGRLAFRSEAMGSFYLQESDHGRIELAPLRNAEGFFVSEDRGEWVRPGAWSGGAEPASVFDRLERSNFPALRILGRTDDFLKVLGERVHLRELDRRLSWFLGLEVPPTVRLREAAFFAQPDARRGANVFLAVVPVAPEAFDATLLASRIHELFAPFERPIRTFTVPRLPRSTLGKVLSGELRALLDACT